MYLDMINFYINKIKFDINSFLDKWMVEMNIVVNIDQKISMILIS